MTQSVVTVPRWDRNAQPQSHSCWLGSGKSALILILTIFGVLVCTGGAQVDPNAGILPFSTHVGGQYDMIDPATGNILLTIPIIN